jgi:hypothetical protein
MNSNLIEQIYSERKAQLEKIKDSICLKLFYSIEEKIDNERQAFLSILDKSISKQEMLNKYSFVLDPQYFDQKFLRTN